MTHEAMELLRECRESRSCWLCKGAGPDTTITVECETPGGKPCEPKQVRVHFGCYMDVEP
jgi:hypothetical protein